MMCSVGAERNRNKCRVGYSNGEQPKPGADTLFGSHAPSVVAQHVAVGWTHIAGTGDTLTPCD